MCNSAIRFDVQVHETRSHHAPTEDDRVKTRKQKAETKVHEAEQSPKKVKSESDNAHPNGKSSEDIIAEFEEFCTAVRENLQVHQMREVLEANGQDCSGSDESLARRWSVISSYLNYRNHPIWKLNECRIFAYVEICTHVTCVFEISIRMFQL